MDALESLTVLDFTSHIAGPYATKLLADLGARVIKVERPGGDPSRRLGPWLADEPGIERSGTYQFLNTNKESIVLDLKKERGREIARDLVRKADLVVFAYPPAVAERLGLTYDTVKQWKDIPVLSITNFGFSGPYRDYRLSDTVLFAMGGEMWSHGTADRADGTGRVVGYSQRPSGLEDGHGARRAQRSGADHRPLQLAVAALAAWVHA